VHATHTPAREASDLHFIADFHVAGVPRTPLGPIVERWLKEAGKDAGDRRGTGAFTGGKDHHENQSDQRAR
jgi:hypothetical protein